jgi:hypothetical protein
MCCWLSEHAVPCCGQPCKETELRCLGWLPAAVRNTLMLRVHVCLRHTGFLALDMQLIANFACICVHSDKKAGEARELLLQTHTAQFHATAMRMGSWQGMIVHLAGCASAMTCPVCGANAAVHPTAIPCFGCVTPACYWRQHSAPGSTAGARCKSVNTAAFWFGPVICNGCWVGYTVLLLDNECADATHSLFSSRSWEPA